MGYPNQMYPYFSSNNFHLDINRKRYGNRVLPDKDVTYRSSNQTHYPNNTDKLISYLLALSRFAEIRSQT